LTGQRKTTGQLFVEAYCPCCITDFDRSKAPPYCGCCFEFWGIICITNYAEKQRAKNERDIEDGGNTLPSTPNSKNTFKNTDVALLTARPLLFNGSPLNLETNARQVTDRLKDTFMKVIAQTERTFTFAHYTGSSNNF